MDSISADLVIDLEDEGVFLQAQEDAKESGGIEHGAEDEGVFLQAQEDALASLFSIEDGQPVEPSQEDVARIQETMHVLLSYATVTEREREVITRLFGLEDGQPRTLEEVGKEFGITRERIRQIERKVLDSSGASCAYRRMQSRGKLNDFLDD